MGKPTIQLNTSKRAVWTAVRWSRWWDLAGRLTILSPACLFELQQNPKWLAVRLSNTPERPRQRRFPAPLAESQFPAGCSSTPEIQDYQPWTCGCDCCRVQRRHSRVPHCRGTWIVRKCIKRLKGKGYYSSSFATCYEGLDSLIKATVAGGGVIPHTHKSPVGKKG